MCRVQGSSATTSTTPRRSVSPCKRTAVSAGASAPTTDPAGAYADAGTGAPTPADLGIYIPVGKAISAAAETVDATGAYNAAGAPLPTDPADAYRGWGARARPLAAARTRIPVSAATSSATKIVNLAHAQSVPTDASEEITRTRLIRPAFSRPETPNGRPSWLTTTMLAPGLRVVEDPAGAYSDAGACHADKGPSRHAQRRGRERADTRGPEHGRFCDQSDVRRGKEILAPPGTYYLRARPRRPPTQEARTAPLARARPRRIRRAHTAVHMR